MKTRMMMIGSALMASLICLPAMAQPAQGMGPGMGGMGPGMTQDGGPGMGPGMGGPGMGQRGMRRGPRDSTLETTAVVHELYLRVNSQRDLQFQHDAQFFAYAARAMRHLLRDRARDRMTLSAGGDWQRITMNGTDELALDTAEQALALDTALDRLAGTDERAAKVVELRYFAGLTLEQIAELFEIKRRTVDRDWRFARAFLRTEIE